MRIAWTLFFIWKWTPESFIGIWKLQTDNKATYVNILPGGGLKMVGVKHSKGYWLKKENELCLGISDYGSWILYKGNIHHENYTTPSIEGNVLTGQLDSHFEGMFKIEPTFLQFHTIQYETDEDLTYHTNNMFEGHWFLESNLLTTNYKTEKGNHKMRKHIIKKVTRQEESRVIHMIKINQDNTWYFCDVNLNPVHSEFKGTWGLYNDTNTINFNSAIKHSLGRGIWFKSNHFEKVYILTNTTTMTGICVDSYNSDPVIDCEFSLREIQM